MSHAIGIRREDKSIWERRAPLVPGDVARLREEHGLRIILQPSDIRIFPEADYRAAGAEVNEDLSEAAVVLGVKEIPVDLLRSDTCYVFFAHVIKGQPYNMGMLARLLELGCTLVDYERIVDEQGRRLIFFGVEAGQAGMIETLYALGRRLGSDSPLAEVEHAHAYDGIEAAKAHLRRLGERLAASSRPLVIGISGYGNVSRGAQEVLACLPVTEIAPEELAAHADRPGLYQVVFKEEHLVRPVAAGDPFVLQDYYDHPERYAPRFEEFLPFLDALVNTIYWEARYPRLVTKAWGRAAFAAGQRPRLEVIGDVSCDVEGSIEMTAKVTEPGEPCYVWNPASDGITPGYVGEGLVIMAVDILPSELPRDASAGFSRVLRDMVPALATTDWRAAHDRLNLPGPLQAAVVTHGGELTPDYRYIGELLRAAAGG